MSLEIANLRTIAHSIARAGQLIEAALSVAEFGGNAAVLRMLKPLSLRAKDVQADIEGRLRAAEKAEQKDG